jgi:hypothetical protein
MRSGRQNNQLLEKLMKTTSKMKPYNAILGNKSYGLYYGRVVSYDPVTEVAVVQDCRHVCRWFGRTGGITNLAAHGLCGPRAAESRVGAPSPESTLAGIVAVHKTTSEADATFADATFAAVPQ